MADRRAMPRWTYVRESAMWAIGLSGWSAVALLAWSLAHQVSPAVIEACVPGTPTRVVAPPFDRSKR